MVRRRVTSGRIIIAAIIVLAMVVAIAPFIHMISLSLSSSGAIVTGRVDAGKPKPYGGNTWQKNSVALILVVLIGLPLFATGDTEGAAERTTLTVELFDRGDVETEGPITQYILENFAEPNNIDFQWKVLPRGEEEAGLTVWMAAGDAPDISFTYSFPLVYSFVTDGGVRALEDLLEQYGADLVKNLGEEVLSYGIYDGAQYAIPGGNPIRENHMFWIRKDWLDAVGLPLPQTREEFYQALVAFKEQDPGDLGDDLVVMGMTSSKWGEHYSNLMTSFLEPSVVNSDRERAGYGWRLYTATPC